MGGGRANERGRTEKRFLFEGRVFTMNMRRVKEETEIRLRPKTSVPLRHPHTPSPLPP